MKSNQQHHVFLVRSGIPANGHDEITTGGKMKKTVKAWVLVDRKIIGIYMKKGMAQRVKKDVYPKGKYYPCTITYEVRDGHK